MCSWEVDENAFWLGFWAIAGTVLVVLILTVFFYNRSTTLAFIEKGYTQELCGNGSYWKKP